jgi:hypothetical protein
MDSQIDHRSKMQESGRGDLGSGRPTFDPSNARLAHACRTPYGVVTYYGSSDGDKATRHERVRRPNHTSVDYSMRRLPEACTLELKVCLKRVMGFHLRF